MNLIIVESPTKAKTIAKFLDNNYQVKSSYGHIRDLPKSKTGIDTENNFKARYVIPVKSQKTVNQLKKAAKSADKVILATDEDREGEAIAWHLTQALELQEEKIERIAFHEITENAIKEAIKSPHNINISLVYAQQARRILDRLVGYELSPFLWKKVAKGLSAGRVQSVAVRFIVEREREIQAFNPEEYWTITADLTPNEKEENLRFQSRLNKIKDKTVKKLEIKNKEQKDKILKDLDGAEYQVANIQKKKIKKNPPTPFTTSTLQQTANKWLGFNAKQTMTIAQKLYEGINIQGEGQVGLITYMRTDSLNLSSGFLKQTGQYLTDNLGEKHTPDKPRIFKTKNKDAQEAHEAIRPTNVTYTPKSLKSSLDTNQHKLYKLIWQRTVATQMLAAELDSTTINIDAVNTDYQFRATGQILKFNGYLAIYPEKSQEIQLPEISKNQKLKLLKLAGEQHFTKPPGRYSDAGLVKKLENYGIGRPSTYAPIISNIITKNYVNRDENKKLTPTDIAFVVNDLLVKHFSGIINFQFTAEMEDNLDEIATGNKKWQPVVKKSYDPFHKNLLNKYEEINKNDIMPEKESKEVCDKCGAKMIIKTGRYGKFLACSAFPDCKNIKPLSENGEKDKKADEQLKKLQEKYKDEICDKCGAAMAIKNGKYGPFLACTAYPKCKNIKSIEENSNSTGVTCPVCGKGEIVQKRSKQGIFYACNQYPDCKTAFSGKPLQKKCPECENLLIEDKNGNVKCSNKQCEYKQS